MRADERRLSALGACLAICKVASCRETVGILELNTLSDSKPSPHRGRGWPSREARPGEGETIVLFRLA